MKSRGISIIEVVAAIFIVTLVAYLLLTNSSGPRAIQKQESNAAASALASELVEFFRSMTLSRLKTYLSTNPVNGALPPYPLCAHINILDRSTGNTVNGDAIADLSPRLLGGFTGLQAANRWYMVEVVDRVTLARTVAACGQNPATYTLRAKPGDPVDEVYYVTVGVSWYPTPDADLARVSFGTLIPD